MSASVKNSNTHSDFAVGRKVRHRRWQRGETQPELAKKLDISYMEVQLYESGVRPIPVLLLKKIARVQETPLNYYLGTRDEKLPTD